MPSTGAGTSADHADGPAAAVGDPTDATEPLEGTPADEEDDEELVFGADDKESIADEDEWLPSRSPAPAAAAKRRGGKGRGHGRGRGRARGAAAAPSAASAAPAPSAAPAAAPAEKVQKYKWKDVAQHKFTPRVQYAGEELPVLSELFDGLTSKSSPYEFFEKLDAPDSEYLKRAVNSENYRDWRVAHKMDGMGKDGMAKRSYRDAAQIEYADMRLLDAASSSTASTPPSRVTISSPRSGWQSLAIAWPTSSTRTATRWCVSLRTASPASGAPSTRIRHAECTYTDGPEPPARVYMPITHRERASVMHSDLAHAVNVGGTEVSNGQNSKFYGHNWFMC